MGKRKDKALIWAAAQSWLNELDEYIVPGVLTREERKSYKRQSKKLSAAIYREQSRAAVKQLRKALAPDVDR
jgi:hypothetical protein